MGRLAQEGKALAAAVGQYVSPLGAGLAVAHLAPRAFFKQHQRDAAVHDGVEGSAHIPYLRKREFGGEDQIDKSEREQGARGFLVRHVQTEIAVRHKPRFEGERKVPDIADKGMFRPVSRGLAEQFSHPVRLAIEDHGGHDHPVGGGGESVQGKIDMREILPCRGGDLRGGEEPRGGARRARSRQRGRVGSR